MTINERKITCTICPVGCKISFKTQGKYFSVCEGYKCNKGIKYAKNEALDPRRMLTTLVLVRNGEWPLVSVKSTNPIPKNKIFSVLMEIRKINLSAPVTSGQIIIKNVANTNIDIIATKSIGKNL